MGRYVENGLNCPWCDTPGLKMNVYGNRAAEMSTHIQAACPSETCKWNVDLEIPECNMRTMGACEVSVKICDTIEREIALAKNTKDSRGFQALPSSVEGEGGSGGKEEPSGQGRTGAPTEGEGRLLPGQQDAGATIDRGGDTTAEVDGGAGRDRGAGQGGAEEARHRDGGRQS